MGLNSLQVCMDSSTDHWLQGTIDEENMMMMDDSSSSPSGDILTCSRPLVERRLRPPHDQALKCPRCDSANTKFCYYNNYSLSQPRYFCKTCRRYWTKGGTLRNIPVGGGCRKNKKVSSKKPNHDPLRNPPLLSSSSSPHNPTDLQLNVQFSHLASFLGNENHSPIDFMDHNNNNKYEVNNHYQRSHDFMGNNNAGDHHQFGGGGGGGHGYGDDDHMGNLGPTNFCSPFGLGMTSSSYDGGNPNFMDSTANYQRLMLPYDQDHGNYSALEEVKPNPKLLALEWQDQGCTSDAPVVPGGTKDYSFGYVNTGGLGSWTGLMNGYGSSTANQLV